MKRILNISEAASIAVHSMVIIANSNELLNANLIAERTGFSRNHIGKVLQQLVKNGLLSSERGPKGGFLLNKKADEIKLIDIYRIVEGNIESGFCNELCNNCPFNKCVFGNLTEKFSGEFSDYMTNTTLSEFLKS